MNIHADVGSLFFHQMSEGLFNFVIGWTFMFAPLLFTDRKRDRYKGSVDILWGLQMFLTNSKLCKLSYFCYIAGLGHIYTSFPLAFGSVVPRPEITVTI